MDERTVEDFGAYDQPRGFNASVGVATPPPNTNPWITPDTKPRWPGQQQPGDQPPPKRNTALWGAIIAVVLVILVAGGFLTYEISQNAFTPTATATETKVLTYTLPDFKGKTCDDARAYIAQQHIQVNLTCNPKTDTSSSPVPVDTIFDQSPAAGTTVNAGSAVTLYYNPAPNTVPVPAVPTNPYMSWTDFCTKVIIPAGLGCHPGNYVNSDIVPAGDVIDTTPAAGTSVAPGTTVNVNISIGPVATPTPTATVPVPTPTNTCLPTGTPPAC